MLLLVVLFILGIVFRLPLRSSDMLGEDTFAAIMGGIIAMISTLLTALLASIMIFIQIRSDREETRRKKSVELGQWFTEQLAKHPEWAIIKRIMKKLGPERCGAIRSDYAISSDMDFGIKIDDELKQAIIKLLNTLNSTTDFKVDYLIKLLEDKNIEHVPFEVIMFLRNGMLSYVNTLEAIGSAWSQAIVDREYIEREFSFVCDDMILIQYVKKDALPGLYDLMVEIKQQRQQHDMQNNKKEEQ